MPGWPTADAIAALDSSDAPVTPTETTTPTTQVVTPSATTPAADETKNADAATPTETPKVDPAGVVDTLKAVISEKGARAFIEGLPEELVDKFQEELYRNLHRKLSARTNERDQERREREALRQGLEKTIETKFDELLTHGMTDDAKKKYFDEKRLRRLDMAEREQQKGPPPEVLEVARQRLGTAWRIITEAGLPADPNDERVRSLDWATDETDFDLAMARLEASARKAARKQSATPATSASPAASPDEEAVKKMAREMAQTIVQEELKKAGVLSVDSGRPGAGAGGAASPKTWDEARKAAMNELNSTR